MKSLKLKKIITESIIERKRKRAIESKKMIENLKRLAKEEFGV